MCTRQIKSIIFALAMVIITTSVESKPLKIDDYLEIKPKMSKKASAKGTMAPKKKIKKAVLEIDDDHLEIKPKMTKKASTKGNMALKMSIEKDIPVDSSVDEELDFVSMSMQMNEKTSRTPKKGVASKKLRFGNPQSKGGTARDKRPTPMPTPEPTTLAPSNTPSLIPSNEPSRAPTRLPSNHPSNVPTDLPSASPTVTDSFAPTTFPSPSATATFPLDDDDDNKLIGQNNTNTTGDGQNGDDDDGDDATDDFNGETNNNNTVTDDISIPDTTVGGTNDTNVTPFIAGVVGLFVLVLGSFVVFRKKKRSGVSRPPAV